MRGLLWVIVLALATALAGCESAPVKAIQQGFKGIFARQDGESTLKAGIRDYQNAR